jgi:hypothetical protein
MGAGDVGNFDVEASALIQHFAELRQRGERVAQVLQYMNQQDDIVLWFLLLVFQKAGGDLGVQLFRGESPETFAGLNAAGLEAA